MSRKARSAQKIMNRICGAMRRWGRVPRAGPEGSSRCQVISLILLGLAVLPSLGHANSFLMWEPLDLQSAPYVVAANQATIKETSPFSIRGDQQLWQGPEPQGGETFGCNRSLNIDFAPAQGQPEKFYTRGCVEDFRRFSTAKMYYIYQCCGSESGSGRIRTL